MKILSVQQALQQVANSPGMIDDNHLTKPVHELVSRTLFDIANRPDAAVRGSMSRANKARDLILKRLVGKRRSGTHPATVGNTQVEFIDMTGGQLE